MPPGTDGVMEREGADERNDRGRGTAYDITECAAIRFSWIGTS